MRYLKLFENREDDFFKNLDFNKLDYSSIK